ncbi:MAG TPA: glycosyltransferase [Ignavibacteriales bacterium]|nr:glycosyltransferase [Ignavibacteriales bacterium]
MKIAMFYHSLISDWNHGNAHFLRGMASELLSRGADVCVYEPFSSWSLKNLLKYHGKKQVVDFYNFYPRLTSRRYFEHNIDLEKELEGADLIIAHEWNSHEIIKKLGEYRQSHPDVRLLFHDTHHRSVTDKEAMVQYDLSNYDGVLAYGEVLREIYLKEAWAQKAWTWHEAADVRIFRPIEKVEKAGDLIWIGNWGDGERTEEINNFLIKPSKNLKLKTRIYGVRYPDDAQKILLKAGIEYCGWLSNYRVPLAFAQFKVTVHIPRRPYVEALPGIPTIRPFEAMACGIPLVSAPWEDTENLFTPGEDYLVAHNTREMEDCISFLLDDPEAAEIMTLKARKTISDRHTCAHRADELMRICSDLGIDENKLLFSESAIAAEKI